jgi:hypothetical protein
MIHDANSVSKVLAMALLNQDRNKVLVGLHLDALATAQAAPTPQTRAACRQAAYAKRRIMRVRPASQRSVHRSTSRLPY